MMKTKYEVGDILYSSKMKMHMLVEDVLEQCEVGYMGTYLQYKLLRLQISSELLIDVTLLDSDTYTEKVA